MEFKCDAYGDKKGSRTTWLWLSGRGLWGTCWTVVTAQICSCEPAPGDTQWVGPDNPAKTLEIKEETSKMSSKDSISLMRFFPGVTHSELLV